MPWTLSQLEAVIRASWSRDTAHDPSDWSDANPARGQCWTTAYVVRGLLGGDIILAEIEGTHPQERHASNRLANGVEIDLTRDQFTVLPELTACEVPEEVIMRLCGEQAEVLRARVERELSVSAAPAT